MRPRRRVFTAIAVSLCCAGPAHAGCCRIALPPGAVSTAIAALAGQSEISVGTTDPALLHRQLPALRMAGSVSAIMRRLGKYGGFQAKQVQVHRWRIEPEAKPVAKPASPPPSSSKDIVVEASKRAVRLDGAALDVTQIGSARIGSNGQASDMLTALSSASSVTSTGWGAGREKLFLRGIADSSFTGSSPSLIGEYWGDQRLIFTAPDPDLRLYDVERVELLAGPQGTLYGSGALAGILRIEAKPPALNKLDGSAWANLTAVAHGAVGQDVGGVLNLPLAADRAAIRMVGYEGVDPGYINDEGRHLSNVNRSIVRGGRADLRVSVSDRWALDVATLAQSIHNRDAPYADGTDAPWQRSSSFAQPSLNRIWASNLTIRGPVGDLDFHATTGLVHQRIYDRFEVHRAAGAGAPFTASEDESPLLLTEDLRLSRSTVGWNWVAGLSALHARTEETLLYQVGTVRYFDTRLNERTDELTAFGEATRTFARRLDVTIGLRIQTGRSSGDGAFEANPFFNFRAIGPTYSTTSTHADSREERLLPSFGASLELARDAHLYVRYEQGYRPGGLTVGEETATFAPDSTGSWEIGLRRGIPYRDVVALTLVGALTDWHNVQADLIGNLGLPVIANIGDGHIYSVEGRLTVHFAPALSADFSATIARSHLDPSASIAADGPANELPNVARATLTGMLDYGGVKIDGLPIDLEARLRHVGRSELGIGRLAVPQGNYTTIGLGATLHAGKAELTAGVENLLDNHATTFAIGTPFSTLDEHQVTALRPRSVRVGIKYLF